MNSAFVSSFTFSLLRAPSASFNGSRRSRSRWAKAVHLQPCRMQADGDQAPKVKSAFYKNPSRAIEKGGGFFIPGLRGPRLRFFVSAVSASLLALNHVLSPRAYSSVASVNTLAISESVALLSITCVFATAVIDVYPAAMRSQPTERKPESQTETETETLFKDSSKQPFSSTTVSIVPSPSTVQWAIDTCTDLTSASHIAIFQAGDLVASTPNVVQDKQGEVADRVRKEGRALYVVDSAKLPPDVTLPFLPAATATAWTTFLVPVAADAVVVFAKPVDTDGFSLVDRRWLEAFAPKFV